MVISSTARPSGPGAIDVVTGARVVTAGGAQPSVARQVALTVGTAGPFDPAESRADELAAYNERREEETANDQLKTHLRGPGKILRSRPPDLVHQEIWRG